MHLVGFIIKKFVTMHGHMSVKKKNKTHFQILGVLVVHPMTLDIVCTGGPTSS